MEFKKPEYISAGVTKDMLVVALKNPKYFFSRETLQNIPLNKTD